MNNNTYRTHSALRRALLGMLLFGAATAQAQVTTFALSAQAYAQLPARVTFKPLSYSGLKDKVLTTTPGGLLKAVSPTSDFTMTVKVIEDRPSVLVIEVSYTGMPSSVERLNVVVADSSGSHSVTGVGSASALLSGGTEATIRFAILLDDSAPQGAFASSKLFVSGVGKMPLVILASQMFDCPKKWLKQPRVIVAEPLGTLPKAQSPGAGTPLERFVTNPNLIKISRRPPKMGSAIGAASTPVNRIQLMKDGSALPSQNATSPAALATPFQIKKTLRALPTHLGGVGMKGQTIPRKAVFRPELINKLNIVDVAAFAQRPQVVKNNNGEGPSGRLIIDVSKINTEMWITADQALTISPQVYGDKRPESGLFYYLPARYVLDFVPDEFLLKMIYPIASNGSQDVHVKAILRAAVNPSDLIIFDEILKSLSKKQGFVYKQLVPFWGGLTASLDTTQAISNGLSNGLSIPPKVSVDGVGLADMLISVNIVLTTSEQLDIFTSLLTTQNFGISGNINYTSNIDPDLTVKLPLEIFLLDRNSLGLNVSSQNIFNNDSPFPVNLKFIHVLSFYEGAPKVYSFSLPDNEIAPTSSVMIDRSKIPRFLTDAPSKMWVDYSVVPTEDSIEKVLQDVTTAATTPATAQVTLEQIGSLPAGVTSVTVVMTSKYFTPYGNSELTKEVQLGASNIIKIYPNGRQEGQDLGAANPYIKWALKVVKNGVTSRTPVMVSNRLTLSIGAAQIGAAK